MYLIFGLTFALEQSSFFVILQFITNGNVLIRSVSTIKHSIAQFSIGSTSWSGFTLQIISEPHHFSIALSILFRPHQFPPILTLPNMIFISYPTSPHFLHLDTTVAKFKQYETSLNVSYTRIIRMFSF